MQNSIPSTLNSLPLKKRSVKDSVNIPIKLLIPVILFLGLLKKGLNILCGFGKSSNFTVTIDKKLTIIVVVLFGLLGLGVTFLNAESVIGLCFFIFVGLMAENSQNITMGLVESRHKIKADFVELMVTKFEEALIFEKEKMAVKYQLLVGLKKEILPS
jgi:hypothetical protein